MCIETLKLLKLLEFRFLFPKVCSVGKIKKKEKKIRIQLKKYLNNCSTSFCLASNGMLRTRILVPVCFDDRSYSLLTVLLNCSLQSKEISFQLKLILLPFTQK